MLYTSHIRHIQHIYVTCIYTYICLVSYEQFTVLSTEMINMTNTKYQTFIQADTSYIITTRLDSRCNI